LFAQIRAKGGDEVSKCSLVNGMMDRMKLKTFVALTMDVTSASPRRYFFEARAITLNASSHTPLSCFDTLSMVVIS
jgi:hypothetical protein